MFEGDLDLDNLASALAEIIKEMPKQSSSAGSALADELREILALTQ